MDFQLFARDERFDYLRGELPDDLLIPFGDALNRARDLLAERRELDLPGLWGCVDRQLRQGSRALEVRSLRDDSPDVIHINRVKALQAMAEDSPGAAEGDVEGYAWQEAFAGLALACVGEELYRRGDGGREREAAVKPDGVDVPCTEAAGLSERYDNALEAVEAVCVGERIAQRVPYVVEYLSEAGRRGGKERNSKFVELQRQLMAHYELHRFQRFSNREAGRRLYKAFQTEVDLVSNADDKPHQIEVWVGKYRKGTLRLE